MTGSTYRDLDPADYAWFSAVELAQRVAHGLYSPVQLVECAVELAHRWEPTINAYAAMMSDDARASARLLEAEARRGRLRGPLHGVPIASKDNLRIAGYPTGSGSLTSAETPAEHSSPMVARLLDAGAIIVGRTTTPEFGWKGTGTSPRTGVSRNPRDPSKNTGGSSAGSAATVASGAVPMATGTDAGGSVRIPASFCGVVGMKPTRGAIPVWPGTVNESLSHAGPIARSVGDVRLAFEITRGYDRRDPQSAYPTPAPGLTGGRPRVAVVRAPFGITPTDEVASTFDEAVQQLRRAQVADLTDIDIGHPVPREVFEALWVVGRGVGFRDVIRTHHSVMDAGLVRLDKIADQYDLSGYLAQLTQGRAFTAWAWGLFDEWDLIMMPTLPLTAFDAEAEIPPGGDLDAPLPWITWTPYTYPFNISGQPAISLPMPAAEGGLPVGLQIVGPWSGDNMLLDFAEQCETVLSPPGQPLVTPEPWPQHPASTDPKRPELLTEKP